MRLFDVHFHFSPLETGAQTASAARELLERFGLERAVFSEPPRPFSELEALDEAWYERRNGLANEAAALCGQIGFYAALPMTDADSALRVLEREKNPPGVQLFTSCGGKYLTDPSFAPLMRRLNARGLPVFLHPAITPPVKGLSFPPPLYEFTFETTRAAAAMLIDGFPKKYPDIKFILCHGAGALPYIAERLDAWEGTLYPADAESRPGGAMAGTDYFYTDCAFASSAPVLELLTRYIPSAHILYGTDAPNVPEKARLKQLEALCAYPGLHPEKELLRAAERLLLRE